MRGTRRRAVNTAREVGAALPDWEEYLAWEKGRSAAVYAEPRARLRIPDPEDEGIEAF